MFTAWAVPVETSIDAAILKPRGGEGEPFKCPDQAATKAAKEKLMRWGAKSIGMCKGFHMEFIKLKYT